MDYGDSVRPLAKLSDMASATPGANTNFFASDLGSGTGNAANRPWPPMTRMTVTVALGGASKLALTINGGAQIFLNGGTTLTANSLYAFSFAARASDTYNLQLDTGAVLVTCLYVDGMAGGN